MAEKKTNLELKKHVATIHSSNKLSLVQRKISNALLYNAYNHLLEKDEHTIHIAQLCKLIGYNSNDYKTIRRALMDLLSTVLEWNIVDGTKLSSAGEGVWNASSIIADASIDGPVCTYSYSNKMKQLLFRPELYGRLNIAVQARFKSSYGLALYENCIRYQDIGQTPWFDLIKFRKLMGVEENKYKIFRDLKMRVLDKAVDEVNIYSPIKIQSHLRKNGRCVSAIQFSIQLNHLENALAGDVRNHFKDSLKEDYGLSQRQVDDVLTHYSEEYIKEKMHIIESSKSFQTGKIQNAAKYLLSALKDDYQSVKIISNKKIQEKLPFAKELILHDKKRTLKEIEISYNGYREKYIDNIISNLSINDKEKFMEKFVNVHSQAITTVISLQRKKYSRENFAESPQIKALMRLFAMQELAHHFDGMQSTEEFVNDLSEVHQNVWKEQFAVENKKINT